MDVFVSSVVVQELVHSDKVNISYQNFSCWTAFKTFDYEVEEEKHLKADNLENVKQVFLLYPKNYIGISNFSSTLMLNGSSSMKSLCLPNLPIYWNTKRRF